MDLMTSLRARKKKPSTTARVVKAVRNLAIFRIAWAFARDRIGGKVPQSRKAQGGRKRLMIIGGAAAGATAGAAGLIKRRAHSHNGQAETPSAATSNGPPERTPTPAGTPHN
jgi:hypothetical protein